jgi:hypothetical protein
MRRLSVAELVDETNCFRLEEVADPGADRHGGEHEEQPVIVEEHERR